MTDVAPETVVWNLLRGGMATRVVGIVADLGVADALAEGPRPVADVAREAGANEDALYRFLRALATVGVFTEVEPRMFRNTEASELLRRDSSWDDFAHLFGGVWLQTIAELDASGKPSFPRLFGTDFWSWLAEHPDERAAFDRAMSRDPADAVERLASVRWRGDETVVDVGGGDGTLLVGLLSAQPSLRGIVFDLPETVRDATLFGDRLEFVPGSFFESVPRGDVYVLSAILHDWNDERSLAILRTVRAAAPDDARLILLEGVVQPGDEGGGPKWLDILMLALLDGRERDERQWRELLERGGFEAERITEGLIEARCR